MKNNQQNNWFGPMARSLGLLACAGALQADVVLEDQFTDPDATLLSAHAPDITSTETNWSGNIGTAEIASNAVRLSGNGQRANIGFTELGAGKTLTLTFETLEGTTFGQSSSQGWELALRLADGTSVFAIGDHRIDYRGEDAFGQPAWPDAYPSKWVITDSVENMTDAGYNTMTQNSGSAIPTVLGTFTYEYDTGAWSIELRDTTDDSVIWETDGTNFTVDGTSTYAPDSQALAQLSFNRQSARAANIDWVQVDISPSGGSPLVLEIAKSGANDLDFTWNTKAGKIYDILSAADLSTPPATWVPWATDLTASPHTAARPADPATFFVLRERDIPPPPAPLPLETFDGTVTGWTSGFDDGVGNTLWELGSPSLVGPTAAHSAPNCYGTNLAADYDHDADTYLRSPVIDLTNVASATLTFQQFVDTDGGADVGTVNVLDADNGDAFLAELTTDIAGIGDPWSELQLPLPAEAIGKNVRLEFRFTSDNTGILYSGWYIDDVEVTTP